MKLILVLCCKSWNSYVSIHLLQKIIYQWMMVEQKRSLVGVLKLTSFSAERGARWDQEPTVVRGERRGTIGYGYLCYTCTCSVCLLLFILRLFRFIRRYKNGMHSFLSTYLTLKSICFNGYWFLLILYLRTSKKYIIKIV